MHKLKLDIRPEVYWSVCVCVLLIPIKLIIAWIIAVMVHEMFHYVTLRLLKCEIIRVKITVFGVYMETSYVSYFKGLLSAAAGPIGSLCLLFVAKIWPMLSVVGFLQGMINLLPFYPLDGGRIIRCLILLLPQCISDHIKIIEAMINTLCLLFSVYVIVKFNFGLISLLVIILPIIKCMKQNYLAKRK